MTDCKITKKEEKKRDQLHAFYKRHTLNSETKTNSKQKERKRYIMERVIKT